MNQVIEALDSVQFLVDAQGNEIAVQMSLTNWEILLSWIEDKTDQEIIKLALQKLNIGRNDRSKVDWLAWEDIADEW